MRVFLFFLLLLGASFVGDIGAAHPKFEEQEAFIPDNPGMSEFFYLFHGEKYVTRVEPSVESHWTPSEEQIATYRTVQFAGLVRGGNSAFMYGIIITGGDKLHQIPGRYITGTLFGTGYPNTNVTGRRGVNPTWTKAGNRWVDLRNGFFVDLETALVLSNGYPFRQIERTW